MVSNFRARFNEEIPKLTPDKSKNGPMSHRPTISLYCSHYQLLGLLHSHLRVIPEPLLLPSTNPEGCPLPMPHICAPAFGHHPCPATSPLAHLQARLPHCLRTASLPNTLHPDPVACGHLTPYISVSSTLTRAVRVFRLENERKSISCWALHRRSMNASAATLLPHILPDQPGVFVLFLQRVTILLRLECFCPEFSKRWLQIIQISSDS